MLSNLRQYFSDRRCMSLGLVFVMSSFAFATWVSRIPFVKDNLQLDEKELGFLLFFLPVGVLAMNALSARVIAAFGQNNILLLCAFALPVSHFLVFSSKFFALVGIGLIFMGLVFGLINIVMNASAANLSKTLDQELLSTSHGLWSLGGFLGALLGAGTILLQISPLLHATLSATINTSIILWVLPTLRTLPERTNSAPPTSIRLPSPYMWYMVAVGICIAVGEGLAFDWSSVYLLDYVDSAPHHGTMGFALFAIGMTVGRFSGDTFIALYHPRHILGIGTLLAGASLSSILCVSDPYIVIAGFGIMGVGISLGAPVLYRMALNLPDYSPESGLATFNTICFLGFVLGPVAIGFIADYSSLRYAFVVVAVMLFLSSLVSRRL